jgi:hypothetical protein
MAITKEEIFNRLVENAFDFLIVAIDDLINSRPKYSVIHFYASIELFVKARLMNEGWDLVVEKDADWNKFINGNFKSVTLDEAAKRLNEKVANELPKKELNVFKSVGRHRNKVVHFYHDAHASNKNDQVQKIVKEQLNAWWFLHRLLSVQWKNIFTNWTDKIGQSNELLREKLPPFLEVLFEKLSPEIERLERNGFIFRVCSSCGFEAQKHDTDQNIVYESKCMVCGLTEQCMQIECPDCGELVFFENEGFATCENEGCRKKFEPEELAAILTDDDAAYRAAKDGDDSYEPGNCSACDGYHTVIKTEDDLYTCTSCFGTFGEYDSLECCVWCNEPNTGDMSDSYTFGCNYCEGWVGWHKDD